MGDPGEISFTDFDGGAPLAITVTGRPPLLTLSGELDMSTTTRVSAAIRDVAEGEALVSLDLTGLTFIDSTGIRTLIVEQMTLRERDSDLVVVNASSRARRVFEMVDVWRTLSDSAVPGE